MLSRRITTIVALVITAVVLMAVGASCAFASAHPFLFSFGTFTNPNGIAVDRASGDVYVADIGTNTVYKFDASGSPVNFSGLGSNALTGGSTPAKAFSFPNVNGNPAAIAIDNSTSASDPSAGDLYVMDAGNKVIDKFSPTGAYLDQIADPSANVPLGFGVDMNGNVRVYLEDKAVDTFNDSVANMFVTTFAIGKSTSGGATLYAPADAFATGPSGDYYALFACGCVEMFGGNAEGLGRVDTGGAPSDVAATVDPATGHLYVDNQSSVVEWDTGGMNGEVHIANSAEDAPSAAQVSSFGSLQLSASSGEGGIAVNGASGNIYVSNPADGKVYVFGSAAPGVAVGAPASTTKTSATLQGTVNPHGIPVTSCQFEYESVSLSGSEPLALAAPVTSFGHSVQCDLTPAQVGSGLSPVRVTADVSGLQPGLFYDFRLVAGNAEGTSAGNGRLATAGPGFGLKAFQVSFLNEDGSPDTQAGSHPYEMVTNIAFNTRAIRREVVADSRFIVEPDGNVKDIVVDLPPGLVGDPNATTTKCTLRQLESLPGQTKGGGYCPPEAIVGELEVEFGADSQLPLREPVYLMVPPHGVAVQIGAQFIIPNALINAGVLAGGDYPVQSTSLEIPTVEPIISTRLTVFGVVGKNNVKQGEAGADTRKPFLTLPTGCTGLLRSSISVSSYQDPANPVKESIVTRDSAGEPLGLAGCSKLEFPPTITVAPDTTYASTSSGLTVGVHVSQKAAFNPDGLGESSLRDTTVALPAGVAINPAGADGLQACSESLAGFTGFTEFNPEFESGVQWTTFSPDAIESLQPGVSFCPDGAKVGTVKIKTPLLPNALEGAVYLAEQNANPFGSLVAMYMMVEDPVSGSTVKLAGEVRLCESTGQVYNGFTCQAPGQIITTFKNTPDLPFEDLELHFFGGERSPLSTPSRCGAYTTRAWFTPWDGNSPVEASSSFTIDRGPNGSPCPGASLPFNPSLTAGTTSIQAGGFSPFTMTMSREDGQQNLQAISLKMPPGLSGLLTGVELCGEAQANAGRCGPNSLIGETIVSVGVGNDPFSVKGGKVYLTGPYKGAPFGLSIVNPAKAGPYDLGQVIVRAKIEVDPITADLTVTSDNEGPYKIPSILDGIPLQIKHVNVTINRPGFTFNPTDCNPMAITGSLDSTEGATDALSVPFQPTNCARLSFKPQFNVSTSGKTSRANGASLHVKLVYPKLPFGSQANIASVKVDLPKQLPSRLTTLQKACVDSVFSANPAACPAASRIGSATATTPLIPVPLTGPAYFVSHGGAKFPELIIVLQGYGVTLDLHSETFINKAGITSSTFHTIPDQPVGSFELTLPEGANSALAANGNLCSATRTVLVKRRVKVRSKGRTRFVTRKVRKTVSAGLVMPTAFNAQNGAVIHENTPIEVTGCSKHTLKGASKTKPKHKHNKKKKGKTKK